VTDVTVFGAGAMGTALAIHLARKGEQVKLWGSRFDERVLPGLQNDRSHPALAERLPESVQVLGPDQLEQAADGTRMAIMAANSNGARSLAGLVSAAITQVGSLVSIAKGLEPGTVSRISEVYREELGDRPTVVIGGPALAPEVADGLPAAAVFASTDADALDEAVSTFQTQTYIVETTTDVAGVELCGTAKNVAAIGSGILEGLGRAHELEYKNARAALFARAVHEMADFVEGSGGRRETAFGLAGMADLLVTSIGGRNRAFGEAVGMGGDPTRTLENMTERGLTVEGVESARDVRVLAEKAGLVLPVHDAVYRVVHEGASPTSILEALR
jgi:glycerol-3-phosphate dehydrogenase (NAD(P)+)